MGAKPGDDRINDVLVVWLAKAPGNDKTLIVGWYSHATVFRKARERDFRLPDGERICYSAEAAIGDSVLVPARGRNFQVESSRTKPGAGFGQKPTWYGAPEVDARVWDYIRNYKAHSTIPPGDPNRTPPKNFDPELRRKVEKAAVTHATAYYKELYGPACDVTSVESLGKGWDLEVSVEGRLLLVEVKGLWDPENLVCELTPNEFDQMMILENRPHYVIYVLNNALAEPPAIPIASIFEHAGEENWRTADGRKLIITRKIAAVLRCMPGGQHS
jgi:hypothetical protein